MKIDLKKRILIVFLSMILLFSSCSKSQKKEITSEDDANEGADNPKYEVLYVGDHPYLKSKFEVDGDTLKVNVYEDSNIPKTKSYTYSGETMTLNYRETIEPYFYANSYHYYTNAFYFDSTTGKLVKSFYGQLLSDNSENTESENKTKLNDEERLEVAKEFLLQYRADLDEYSIEVNSPYSDIRFVRIIDGLETTDEATVYVASSGNITAFDITAFGHMGEAKAPSKTDLLKLEMLAKLRVESFMKYYDFEYDYVIRQPIFTRLKDGRYALAYSGEYFNLENESEGDVFSLLVYLD